MLRSWRKWQTYDIHEIKTWTNRTTLIGFQNCGNINTTNCQLTTNLLWRLKNRIFKVTHAILSAYKKKGRRAAIATLNPLEWPPAPSKTFTGADVKMCTRKITHHTNKKKTKQTDIIMTFNGWNAIEKYNAKIKWKTLKGMKTCWLIEKLGWFIKW